MNPINIIGAGMAGSILAKLLRKEGIEFRLFDARKVGRASMVSENLIGVNWYKNQKDEVRKALTILKSIVPVRIIEAGTQTAHHVYTNDLLEQAFINSEVELTNRGVRDPGTKVVFEGFNIVCAGVWTRYITNVQVQGVVGHGLIYQKATQIETIKPFKPFRFEKLINRNVNETWYSNSLAVNEETYFKHGVKYQQELFDDAKKFANLNLGVGTYATGHRPLTSSHNNLMIQGGMVITGGYKSGMLYYPIQCQMAVDFIKDQARFL